MVGKHMCSAPEAALLPLLPFLESVRPPKGPCMLSLLPSILVPACQIPGQVSSAQSKGLMHSG